MENIKTQIVLLPGLDGTGMLFRPFQQVLDPNIHCKIVAYPLDQELELADLAAIVLRQSSDINTVNAVFLAESFSGLVALTLLAQSRIQMAGVIFVGAFAEPPRPLLLRLSGLVSFSGRLMRSVPSFLIRQYCLGADATAAQLEQLRQVIRKVSPSVLAHRMRLITTHHSFGKAGFDVPCCYMRATEDRLVPASSAQWFQQRFNSVHVEDVKGPHFLLQARPRECAKTIERAVRWMTARGTKNQR